MKYQSQSQNDLQKLNAQLEEHLAASEKCANEAISCENNTTLEAQRIQVKLMELEVQKLQLELEKKKMASESN